MGNFNLSYFIAKRIYNNKGSRQNVSRPSINIATVGVGIGVAIMILTVSIVLGFKKTIENKVIGFGCQIQVENFQNLQNTDMNPIAANDSLLDIIKSEDNVVHAQRFSLKQGILKTDSDFLGIVFKGIGADYNLDFLKENISEGQMPAFTDSTDSNKIVISQLIANKLNVSCGDKLFAYFVSESDIRVRRLTVAAIFKTNMAQFDKNLCYINGSTINKINSWKDKDLCMGIEIMTGNGVDFEDVAHGMSQKINGTQDSYNNTLVVKTIKEKYPQIFTWLDVLDINVIIILVLMICVAGFTMISGLLIIILERVRMIGVLKAMGATDKLIRHTFLWFATFIIARGLFWGNLIAVSLVTLQKYTGFIKLDPEHYYVNTAPVEFSLMSVVVLNMICLITNICVLIAPSYLISHIRPVKSIRYE